MISKRYKTIFDFSNCMLIYLLGLGASLGVTALARYDKFSWQYALMSAIVLFAYTMIRLFVNALPVSFIAHIIILAVSFYIPYGNNIHKYMIAGFALLIMIIDMNDFYKKKNQSFGVIHFASCSVFLAFFAYVDYAAEKVTQPPKQGGLGDVSLGAKYHMFATFVCLICIAFFAFVLIRAYVANAIKLADNSQIDENAPVDYMYGNSNRFIGPIIALIIAVMLVIQSRASENIFAALWTNLLKGVAGVFNLFSFVQSSQVEFASETSVAPAGTTLYYVEVVVASIILALVVAAIAAIITKIYKSHWHKDISSDETLESAAMVEKREWIYHKESKKAPLNETSVTKAAEIPNEIVDYEDDVKDVAQVKEEVNTEAADKVEEVKENVQTKVEEAKAEVEKKVEEVKENAEEKAADVTAKAEEKAEEVKEVVEEKAEAVKDIVEEKAKEAQNTVDNKVEEALKAVDEKKEGIKDEVKEKAEDVKEAVKDKKDTKSAEGSKNNKHQSSSYKKK